MFGKKQSREQAQLLQEMEQGRFDLARAIAESGLTGERLQKALERIQAAEQANRQKKK